MLAAISIEPISSETLKIIQLTARQILHAKKHFHTVKENANRSPERDMFYKLFQVHFHSLSSFLLRSRLIVFMIFVCNDFQCLTSRLRNNISKLKRLLVSQERKEEDEFLTRRQ